MSLRIEKIMKAIEPLRQEIINHKVYAAIKSPYDLKVFMEYHIYAVWDFMSLLKALQNNLTCTSLPWFPKGDGETRHLINEIVVGEESDEDLEGNRTSHFEMYIDAMKQCGANTLMIKTFINELKKTSDFSKAYKLSNTPEAAAAFVDFTFDIINSNKDYLQAAIFTFGREDLIPKMFMAIVNDIDGDSAINMEIFKYYLERHIELDGDHHSHLALQLTAKLCGDNDSYWEEAEKATIASLQQRVKLWDGVYEQIVKQKEYLTENV